MKEKFSKSSSDLIRILQFKEFEIDKALGITGPADVAKMGIKAYNAECRKIVMRYSQDWEDIVTRLGRWIGKNSYLFLFLFWKINEFLFFEFSLSQQLYTLKF